MAAIPVVGPVLGAIAAAAAIVAGLANVRKIDAQTYTSSIGDSGGAGAKPPLPNYGKNYGDGGMIEGPRHAGGGVMINAEGGEDRRSINQMTRNVRSQNLNQMSVENQALNESKPTNNTVVAPNISNSSVNASNTQAMSMEPTNFDRSFINLNSVPV
jgi:hypothetical protein